MVEGFATLNPKRLPLLRIFYLGPKGWGTSVWGSRGLG